MRRFKRILVGVDLSYEGRLVSSELPPPTLEAIERAFWLARINAAHLTFMYSLDLSARTQRVIDEAGENSSIVSDAESALQDLVLKAAERGICADIRVCFGKSWLELTRQAIQGDHDLVIVGTRHLGTLKGNLIGSTGAKLLRQCPCPVWITQPDSNKEMKSVLVAHCLRPVGETALEIGCSMANLQRAELHVLHALDTPDWDGSLLHSITPEKMEEFHAAATNKINEQLADCGECVSHVHIVNDSPDVAVLRSIEKNKVDIVVMGTVARTGIGGMIIGNTAERLLPKINCSVIAVKPVGFVSPVKASAVSVTKS